MKNTGARAGKTSVQLYVQQPYTQHDKNFDLGKSSIMLANYEKVELLPGETKTVKLDVERYFLATYDYKLYRSYILEGGDYYFALGNGAHEALNNIIKAKSPNSIIYDHLGNVASADSSAVVKVLVNEDVSTYTKSHYNEDVIVKNEFNNADYNYYAQMNSKSQITYLSREDWEGTWPTQTTTSPATDDELNMAKTYVSGESDTGYASRNGIDYNVQYKNKNNQNETIKYNDMVDVPLTGMVETGKFAGQNAEQVWDAFIKQMSIDDLKTSISDVRGIRSVNTISSPGMSWAEGSEGLLARFKYGDRRWATGFPTASIYAGTFDHAMQQKYGHVFGKEAELCDIDVVNGPGANIVRTAFCGRNSEYMSEDAMLSYYTAANIVSAAKSEGLIMNIKHCFLNNQEDGRQRIQTYCNEQAIREIYLRSFEGAITKGGGMGIMTSYNRIGATYAACYSPLSYDVLRNEWGFKGFIMCDALTGSNTDSYSNGPTMIVNGTDIFCLDENRGSQLRTYIQESDDLTVLNALQRANKNILYAQLSVQRNNKSLLSEGYKNKAQYEEFSSKVLTSDIKSKINAFKGESASEVVVKEHPNYNFSDPILTSSRDNVSLVYKFLGSYAEGWQGDYSQTYGTLSLWSDGVFTYFNSMKPTESAISGYWYNSSIENGIDEKGSNTVDCLELVSNNNRFEFMCASSSFGSLDMRIVCSFSPGYYFRSMVMQGGLYSPSVCLKMISQSNKTVYTVGEKFSLDDIDVLEIFKNSDYRSVKNQDSLNINVPAGMLVDGKCASAGTFTISATYGSYTTSMTIKVSD